METYSYEATTRDGNIVTGTIEAANKSLAVDRIQERGYFPLKISRTAEHKVFIPNLLSFTQPRVREPDILTFTYQLGVLLEAGFPLERALFILSDLVEKKALGEIIKDVLSQVRSGKSFSEALSKFPSVFSLFYVNMIKAGEAGGFLEDTTLRMAAYLENSQALKQDIRSALIYPIILSVAGIAAVVFLLTFVVPRFTVIFSDMGSALPLPTVILLAISNTLRNFWWLISMFFIGGFLTLRRYIKTDNGKLFWENLKFKLPLFGKLYRETVVSRFARTMGTLLRNGVPILNALQIVKGTLGSERMADIISSVREGVRKGKGISEPLKNNDIFPPIAVHMVTVGEETGKLDEMFIKVADRFDLAVRTTVKRLLSMLGPALIMIMGIIIGFIVIAMLLAIFSINELPF